MAKFRAVKFEEEIYRRTKKMDEKNPADLLGLSTIGPKEYAERATGDPVRANVVQHKAFLRRVVGRISATIPSSSSEKKALSDFIIKAHDDPPHFNIIWLYHSYSVPTPDLEEFVSKVGGKRRAADLLRQFDLNISKLSLPLTERNIRGKSNARALHMMNHGLNIVSFIASRAQKQIEG